ncbi:MAG: topology modulation protein [Oscillospiraceae bacterium]
MNIESYRRIVILGPAGSGKSWLAKKLAASTGYPIYHLDMEFWKPGWVETPKEEWIARQEELVRRESWIIEGTYASTLEIRYSAADLIILLDLNPLRCMWSAFRRHGKKRSDLPEYLEEHMNWEFVEFCGFILDFRKKNVPKVLALRDKYPDKKLVILKSRREVSGFAEKCSL